jgi:hypothetical protein
LFKKKDNILAFITIEHGMVKLLTCDGLNVLDYRVLLANPRFFREGQVSNNARVGTLIQNVLPEMEGHFDKVIGGLPGFQSRLQLLELPNTGGLNPNVVIPQEASRVMKVSTETYHLSWHRLPDLLDRSRWLVLAASRRSINSFMDTAQRADIRFDSLDLRPFALARAVNYPEAVIAWVAPDGCDVIIVRDWVPVEHQSLFWGAELVEDTVLVDRLTEIVGRTIATYDQNASEGPLNEEAPLFVCGSPIRREPEMANRVASNLNRDVGELVSPLTQPDDFPVQDLIVNIGLILREA